jgi:hypothetical protein
MFMNFASVHALAAAFYWQRGVELILKICTLYTLAQLTNYKMHLILLARLRCNTVEAPQSAPLELALGISLFCAGGRDQQHTTIRYVNGLVNFTKYIMPDSKPHSLK